MKTNLIGLAFAAVAIVSPVAGVGQTVQAAAVQPSPIRSALATAARFHAALARGDSAEAARLLAADAMILESGELETRAEYIAHHLGADIEFAKGVPSKRTIGQVRRDGNVVWLVATSVSKGTFHQKPIDSRGAELMVLRRTGPDWKIRTIHWS